MLIKHFLLLIFSIIFANAIQLRDIIYVRPADVSVGYDSNLRLRVVKFFYDPSRNYVKNPYYEKLSYLLVIGTNLGKVYTFNPNAIQQSFTSLTMANLNQIDSIKFDYEKDLIFVASNNNN